MDVYKILRAAGVAYVPAKQAWLAAMSQTQRAARARLWDAADEASRMIQPPPVDS
jgi:hypothetical protein